MSFAKWVSANAPHDRLMPYGELLSRACGDDVDAAIGGLPYEAVLRWTLSVELGALPRSIFEVAL
jgi:hypothetical protein